MSLTWRQALRSLEARLDQHHQDKTVAKDLCMFVSERSGTAFYLFLEELLLPLQVQQLADLEARLLQGEPLAYLVNKTQFYGLTLEVNPQVLIPRPETEELVAWILQDHDDHPLSILDVGTGSGNLALALKKQRPHWHVSGSDLSEAALQVARNNGRRHQLQVEWVQGDLLEPFRQCPQKWDLLVSNPPYVAFDDEVQPSVVRYEPNTALYAAEQGLACYHKMLQMLPEVLVLGGIIYFEFGSTQAQALRQLVHSIHPMAIVEIRKDVSGNDRMLKAVFPAFSSSKK